MVPAVSGKDEIQQMVIGGDPEGHKAKSHGFCFRRKVFQSGKGVLKTRRQENKRSDSPDGKIEEIRVSGVVRQSEEKNRLGIFHAIPDFLSLRLAETQQATPVKVIQAGMGKIPPFADASP